MGNVVFDSCGTSIFEEMSRLAMRVDAVNLGQGFPEGLEPKEVVEAAMRALRDGPHQYPPMLGLPALRQAVAANARRFLGLEVDWEREVLVTSGATEALADAFFGLLNRGRRSHPDRAGLRQLPGNRPPGGSDPGSGAPQAAEMGAAA